MQHLQKLSFWNYLALDLYVLLATYSSPTTFHGEKTFSNLELGMKQYTLLCAKSSTIRCSQQFESMFACAECRCEHLF